MPTDAIFRKAALERLASPEQLDEAIEVVRPRGWIILGSIGLLLLVAVVFAFTAGIPTRVSGSGILIAPGGMLDVLAPAGGQVSSIAVAEGAVVRKGDVLATITQPDLERAVSDARARLAELQNEHDRLAAFAHKDVSLQNAALVQKKANLQSSVQYYSDRTQALRERLRNEEQLFQQGVFTQQTLLATRQELFAAVDQLEKSRASLNELHVQQLSIDTTAERDLYRKTIELNEARRQVRSRESTLQAATRVLSPASGRVIEVKANSGVLIQSGQPVASLHLTQDANPVLRLVAYVPAAEGKRIRPGMEVHVSPTTASAQESGYLLARVTYVSEFPTTIEAMRRVLGNEELVRTLSGAGAPFAVYADLERDPKSPGRYLWSSRRGAKLTVNSGTLCSATVVVRRQRPIDLILPSAFMAASPLEPVR